MARAKKESVGIHPRVENGRAIHDKKNTCAPRSSSNGGQGSKTLRRVTRRLALRRAAYDRLPETAKRGCRKPGSMKP